jgi:hypothetical protein
MNDPRDERLRALLKSSIAPAAGAELQRDLWPEMLRRLSSHAPARQFGLLDWLAAAVVGATLLIFPGLIPGILYQL